MSAQDCTELVDLLSQRVDLLTTIGPEAATKRELVTALPVSRSTVDRGVRALEGAGLVVRERGAIRRTLTGDLVVDAYDAFVGNLEALCEAGAVLEFMPRGAPVPLELLRGATAVTGSEPTPLRPATEIEEFVTGADELAGYIATVLPSHVDLYVDRLEDAGCGMDLVFTDAVLETLLAEFSETVEATLYFDNLRTYATSAQIHCTLLIRESNGIQEVCVAAHDDHGIAGVIRNDSEAAVRWGWGAFRSIRYDADELTTDLSARL